MKLPNIFESKTSYLDISFGVILLVIIVTVFIFFHRKVTYVDIRVKVTDQDVLYAATNPKSWYANQFRVGDTEYDALGRITSKITGVSTFNMTEDTKAVYLNINIKATYDPRTKIYTAKGTHLNFGSVVRFDYPDIAFNALVTESPSIKYQDDLTIETKTVSVIARGPLSIEPQALEKIKKGDTITDSDGNILAEVTNITLRPGQRVTTDINGNLHLKSDPYYKDAIITLSMRTKKYHGEEFVFDTVPLKLNFELPLNLPYETIYPRIIEVK